MQQSISSGNDYSIALKANPPNLFKLLAAHLQLAVPLRVECQVEQTRERQTQRRVTGLAIHGDLGGKPAFTASDLPNQNRSNFV